VSAIATSSVLTTVVAQPELEVIAESAAMAKLTVTSPVYQPFEPIGPVMVGVTTGTMTSAMTVYPQSMVEVLPAMSVAEKVALCGPVVDESTDTGGVRVASCEVASVAVTETVAPATPWTKDWPGVVHVSTGGVVSILSATFGAVVVPPSLVAVHPGSVQVPSVTICGPQSVVDNDSGDSGSLTAQETATGVAYQPCEFGVPPMSTLTTGGVVSVGVGSLGVGVSLGVGESVGVESLGVGVSLGGGVSVGDSDGEVGESDGDVVGEPDPLSEGLPLSEGPLSEGPLSEGLLSEGLLSEGVSLGLLVPLGLDVSVGLEPPSVAVGAVQLAVQVPSWALDAQSMFTAPSFGATQDAMTLDATMFPSIDSVIGASAFAPDEAIVTVSPALKSRCPVTSPSKPVDTPKSPVAIARQPLDNATESLAEAPVEDCERVKRLPATTASAATAPTNGRLTRGKSTPAPSVDDADSMTAEI
jgi:hypothetical protein